MVYLYSIEKQAGNAFRVSCFSVGNSNELWMKMIQGSKLLELRWGRRFLANF